jgi:hypothetical protein
MVKNVSFWGWKNWTYILQHGSNHTTNCVYSYDGGVKSEFKLYVDLERAKRSL